MISRSSIRRSGDLGQQGGGRDALIAAAQAARPIAAMASPPIVTFGADNTNSTILTNKAAAYPSVFPDSASLRQAGGLHRLLTGNTNRYTAGFSTVIGSDGTKQMLGSNGWGYEFGTDADAFDFAVVGQAGRTFRILVDEHDGKGYQLVTQGSAPATINGDFSTPTTGASNYVLVTFASAKPRNIMLQFSSGLAWNGLNIGATYKVWPVKARPRIHVTGDSYANGGSGVADYVTGSWAHRMGERLGCELIAAGVSGQGIVDPQTDQNIYSNYLDRVGDLALFGDLDVCLVTSFINDFANAQSAAQVQANLSAWLLAARRLQPRAAIGIVGPFSIPSKALPVDYVPAITAAFSAVADSRMFLVDASAWISGTGKVGSTNGSGNADRLIRADGVHPVQIGHDYIGERAAMAVLQALLEMQP